ncbi:MAG: type I-U CRISPR-associated protein Cas5/Cas6 [Gammaproteobacteria bacterium]|nr:type I-U CRISPR-associated protein Cas5/Cas6 [Gammaproteobacteria bacterium]
MAAADGPAKHQAEWPPHPDRVFMALAAAWFESGEPQAEGEALTWLEGEAPPRVAASAAEFRRETACYVPTNDATVSNKAPASNEPDKLLQAGLAVLPARRPRKSRGFTVTIPHDPVVHLIWPDTDPTPHRRALESLVTKVTRVGNSMSFAQLWIEDQPPPARWLPTGSFPTRQLRVPRPGRLDGLRRNMNRAPWLDYHDRQHEIEQVKALQKQIKARPPRSPWADSWHDAVLLADEPAVKQHPSYRAAKAGNPRAAAQLVDHFLDEATLERVHDYIDGIIGQNPALIAAHAYESAGVNAIPAALATRLATALDIEFLPAIVQSNVVGHTGANGYARLARQAGFDGEIGAGRACILVDDFVGQGGTLANLKGHVEQQKSTAIGAIVLSGKPYSARLALQSEQLDELRKAQGKDFERWWKDVFGHRFDCLTQSEARYLARSPSADTIRDRLAQAQWPGNIGNGPLLASEQNRQLKALKATQTERHPEGPPRSTRPTPGAWQGYRPARASEPQPPASGLLDPSLLVLTFHGPQPALVRTLAVTRALRNAWMAASPKTPPPEWLSGHRPDGAASRDAHIAALPLPFVDHAHASGLLLGIALALPRSIDTAQASNYLGPLLYQPDSAEPRPVKLYSGREFEFQLLHEQRESPPLTLTARSWTRPATEWTTVTPLVFDRHFKRKDYPAAAIDSVKLMCERMGLPAPTEVLLHPTGALAGVPHACEFPGIRRKRDGGRCFHTHVTLGFTDQVAGPVILGAGRYRGYGLFRPNGTTSGRDAHR